MSEYGLPGVRDKDGDLREVEHTYEWDGEEITIKILPPTTAQLERYENFGDDVDADKLRDVVDEHLVKPDIPEDKDLTARELFCYMEGVMDHAQGSTGLAEEVREEIEARSESAGNQT